MSSSESHHSSQPEPENKPYKLFVTNLDAQTPPSKLQEELRELFSKYGQLQAVAAKKSFNGKYSFAFVDFKEGADANEIIKKWSHDDKGESQMKVEIQDNAKRRKGATEICFNCGRPGHFAKSCRDNSNHGRGGRDRDRHRRNSSESDDHKKKKSKKRKHQRSSSSESRSLRKKQKKISKKEKKHSKKSKKEKNYSDSDDSN